MTEVACPDSVPEVLRQPYKQAAGLLLVDEIEPDLVERVRALLLEGAASGVAVRDHCDRRADSIARIVGKPGRTSHKVLTPEGWLILDFGRVRPQHVYAVAAILAVERFTGEPDALKATLDCHALAHEAMFMAGRHDMLTHAVREEKKKRAERGAEGGQPTKFSDDQMLAARDAWISREGKERGWIKQAARELDVSESAVSKRWSNLKKHGTTR